MLARFKTKRSVIIFNLGGGDSLALNGSAYTSATGQGKPITAYFVSGISIEHKPYLVKLRYSQDDWGPESWQRSFGETYDRLYQLHVSRNFGNSINAGMEYVKGVGQQDNSSPELGSFDEVRLFFSVSFGAIITFAHPVHKSVTKKPVHDKAPVQKAADSTPPQVSLGIPVTAFLPMEGRTLEMRAWATGLSGIDSWEIEVTNSEGKIIRTFSGDGRPPYMLKWDGKDDFRSLVPAGSYSVKLLARDECGNTANTDPVEISLKVNPIVTETAKEVNVTETERGLQISMTSKVLFDPGESTLKQEAGKSLDEVVKILNTYKDNMILVEGHTDGQGNAALNRTLSELRAKSVADYLISVGVAANRIKVSGLGKSKPVATNSTAQGREANRRVEVIILKQ